MTKTRREIEDEWLVLASQEGSTEAFNRLVARWQQSLWRKARQVTGNDELAKDALQEAWFAIIRGLGRLEEPGRFASWARQIVHNKCCNLLGNDRRRQLAQAAHLQSQDIDSEQDAIGVDPEQLAQAIKRLKPKHREVLTLHYRDGFDVTEIAALIGVPAGTVKSRLHHARDALKERLK